MTELITFYQFMVLVVGLFICGWVGHLSYEQFKTEQRREQETDERRRAYIQQQRQKQLWEANMREVIAFDNGNTEKE